ncbi:hypothetical protein HBH70_199540 [Parastagonospora nodorum]|nr:hypothetical protein HBH70_199540 [Parastagonospora nodorum]
MLFASYVAPVIVLALLSLLFLIARYSTKRTMRLPWTSDDTLLLLSLICLYIVVALFLVAMVAGHVHEPIQTANKSGLQLTLMVLWLFRIPMALSLTLTRCAITVFFIRTLFTHGFPCLRHIAYGCIFFAIGTGLATILGILLHCHPIKYNWTLPLKQSGHCFNLEPFVVNMAALGVALDLLTWTIPHCVVWRLQLRLAHKMAITAIFALGILNVVIGGLRISVLTEVAYGRDVTYGIGTSLMWAIAQMSTGIIVACCPHLRPLFEKIVPNKFVRVHTRKSTPQDSPLRTRQASITVMTRIELQGSSPSPAINTSVFHEGHLEPWAPTFVVGTNPVMEEAQDIKCCTGCIPLCPRHLA